MTPGPRTHGAASLEVTEVDRMQWGLNVEDHARVRLILKVRTEPERRRCGDAAWLLNMTCAEADQDSTVLVLEPRGNITDAPMSDAQLRDWYARLGFVTMQETPIVLMGRAPK